MRQRRGDEKLHRHAFREGADPLARRQPKRPEMRAVQRRIKARIGSLQNAAQLLRRKICGEYVPVAYDADALAQRGIGVRHLLAEQADHAAVL